MKQGIFSSLTVRIGAMIVLTKIIVLAVLGIFYTRRFHAQIDLELRTRIQLPSQLMNSGLLDLDAVEDKEMMEQLVGQDLAELRDGLIFSANDSIDYSYDPAHSGKTMTDVHGVTVVWSEIVQSLGLSESVDTEGDNYLTYLSRIQAIDRQDRAMFLFLRVKTNRAEVRKATVKQFFLVGAFAAVFVTSLVIVVLLQSSFVSRVSRLLSILRRVEEGDLTARVEAPIGRDEIGAVQHGVNSMAMELEKTVTALRENEARYRAIVEDQTELIVRGLPDGTQTFVNKSYCEFFGLDSAQAIGSSFYDFIVEKDQEAVRRQYASLTPEQPVAAEEHQFIKPNGEIGWQHWIDRAFFDEGGKFVEFQAVGRDITERKRAEAALKESQERFRLLSEAAFEGIVISDHGTVVDVNERLAEMLRYEPAGMKGKTVMDFVATASRGTVLEKMKSSAETPYEHLALRSDGSTFPVEVQAKSIPFEGQSYRVTAIRDISERKQAEEALRRYTERLKALRDIDKAILSVTTLKSIAEVGVQHLRRLIPCYRATVYVLDDEARVFEVVATDADEETWLKPGFSFPREEVEEWKLFQPLEEGEFSVIADLLELGPLPRPLQAFLEEGIRSGFSIPLLAHGQMFGILILSSKEPHTFSEQEIEIADEVANSLAVALQQARLFDELSVTNQRVVQMSRRLVALQEEERRRLAQELHDEVGGLLSALQLAINRPKTDEEGAQEQTEIASGLVDSLIDEIRTLSLRLRPPVLDDLGLVPALRWLFKRYEVQTNISVEFDHNVSEYTRFSSELETTAYRITQEALTNVARHAEVNVVDVQLSKESEKLIIHIIDMGKGFNPDDIRLREDSLGISGMMERAALLEGTLSFQSAPGSGTHVKAILPLDFSE